jgi:hypothetical protein
MKRFQPATLLHIGDRFHELQTAGDESELDLVIPAKRAELYRARCQGLALVFGQLELRVSKVGMDDLARHLSPNVGDQTGSAGFPTSYSELRTRAGELHRRLIDEVSIQQVFVIPQGSEEHYAEPRKGWEPVIDRFPDALTHIEEARKCMALQRYGGAVLHTLQIIEVGLIELGQYLGVSDPKSGWTATSNKLKEILRKDRSKLDEFERKNRAFYEQLDMRVEALKNAWRNKVNHAQGYPRVMQADFAQEIAEEILMATRGFMRELAGGLPEMEIPF